MRRNGSDRQEKTPFINHRRAGTIDAADRHWILDVEILEVLAAGDIEDRRNAGVAGVAPVSVPTIRQVKFQRGAVGAVFDPAGNDKAGFRRWRLEGRGVSRQATEQR